jgi:hypothetical protein
MNPVATPVFDTLYRFLIGKLSIADIADWVYHTDTIGEAVGSDWDTALLGFDYRVPDAEPALRRLIRRIYQDIRPGLETDRLFWQLDVVLAAVSVLDTTADFIDSAGRLCSLCEAMQADCWSDPDFSVFCIIADQSDFLPRSTARAHLSAEALAQIEHEQAGFEAFYRTDALQAAQRLIERFELR